MEEPVASNFGWIVRLCTHCNNALHYWRWTCCRHQHQKHMLNASSTSVECWRRTESAEEEFGYACLSEAEQ